MEGNRIKTARIAKGLTQEELGKLVGVSGVAIMRYEKNQRQPKQKLVYKLSKVLDVNEAWLMGYDVPMERDFTKYPDNILKIEIKKFPLLGTIAAGQPIFAEEHFESYVEAGANIRADFCLRVKGDSMINARICDGDIVFIRKQPDVNDGEIAAVLIDNEATLKRVYKKKGEIILVAENPAYKPLVYKGEELNEIRILGKAIAFQSNVI